MPRILSTDVIRKANASSGFFFFQPEAMRFFRSRVSSVAYRGDGGTYFVTSERFNERSPRRFTVRAASDDGRIDTVGEFQAYRSRRVAHEAARLLADGAVASEVSP